MRDREIELVVASLQSLVGLPCANTWQPTRDRVLVGLASNATLLLVPRGTFARIHTVRTRPRNPARPFSFQGACRAHLHGRLRSVHKLEGDRIVELDFGETRLHLRLTGRSGGLWLLRGEAVVAAFDGPTTPSLPALASRPATSRPVERPPRFEPTDGETWDEAARRWFTQAERNHRLEQRRVVVTRALRRQLNRSLRLREHLEADLDRASEAPLLRGRADLLAANLHAVPRGATSIALPDFDDPERLIEIPLDPAQPPVRTMEALYRKARRLDRVGDRVLKRLDALEPRIERERQALETVADADAKELDRLRSLAPRDGGGRTRPTSPHWHTWTGPNGEIVLVGKDEKSNRRLTFQKARGSDFWMHLRDRPGAHIVIPTRPGRSAPLELLLAAAQIALVRGRVPVGSSADVQYTRVRHVRSIRDSGGRVQLFEEKVLRVRRDPAALVGWTRD